MTKKGYQKRLPTILPQAPPRPPVPAPRSSPDAAEVVAPAPEPVETIESLKQFEWVEWVEPPPQETRSRRSPSIVVVAALVLAVLALVSIAALLVPPLLDDEEPPPAAAPTSGGSTGLAPDTAYVESRVLSNGDILVSQQIHAEEPVWLLLLTLPHVPGAEDVIAREVDIVADGEAVAGPATVTDTLATYGFSPATELQLSYRLTGAVEPSDSVPGRALALVTTLHIRYGQPVNRETRVVRAADVLSLACSRSTEAPLVPCGQPAGQGRWRVELTGPHVDDRVVAQLTLR